MTNLDLRPLSVGEILDRTFTLYRRNFLLFAGITALPQLFSLAVQLARTYSLGKSSASFGLGLSLTGIIFLLVVLIATFLASLFSQGATFLAVNDLYLGRPVSVSDCLRRAWGEIGTVFAIGILNALAIGVGLLALVIPGIYIFCRLLVCLPVALTEQRSAVESLSRSWRLTTDNAGRAFVIVLLYFVISIAAAMLFQLPFTIATIAYRNNFAMLQIWTAITQIGDALINIVISPILLIASSVFYFDLRVRKEGFDLQIMMDPNSERMTPPGTGSIPSIIG